MNVLVKSGTVGPLTRGGLPRASTFTLWAGSFFLEDGVSTKEKPIDYRVNEDGCHECRTHTGSHFGYPKAKRDGIYQHIHRHVFGWVYGPIPPGMCVLHTCDNPLCINPEHLFLGTRADNIRDMREKGRVARGEANGCAKLTEQQILAICHSTQKHREIAHEYSIHRTTVGQIKNGRRWGWLTGETQ